VLSKLNFGYQQPNHTFADGPESTYKWLERVAVDAEHTGFDSFWIMDHLTQIPIVTNPSEPILEPYVTLSAIASKTSRIKLGALVTSNTFRNPALLAKMAATLDVISNGRLFFGIGAGWYEAEHIQYNIPFYTTGERIRRLEEAIQIVKKVWMEDRATFKGRYYEINELICNPKPVQKPHPPILVGGGGEKMTLKVVAKHADACNLGAPLDVVQHKLRILKGHCEAVGRDYNTIRKTKLGRVIIDRTEEGASIKLEKMQQHRASGISLEQYKKESIFGSPRQCIEQIQKLADAGIDYLIISFAGPYDPMNMKIFAEEVMPSFRS